MRKVLIITYYWPPAGSSGVQRWLKFVKYFRDFGWEPVIYTSENPEVAASDDSLQKDIPENIIVIRRSVPEPYTIYKYLTGNRNKKIGMGFTTEGSKNKGLINWIAIWVRGNFFIPDARMFWINPSVRFLQKYLKENPIDLIVSSGPPHSLHLIALKLKKRLNIPWIADFRDPWTTIYFYKNLHLTPLANYLQKRLELKVLNNANFNVVVSQAMAKEFYHKGIEKIKVIENGFDHEDYLEQFPLDEKFSIVHVGTIPPKSISPNLWRAIKRFVNYNNEFSDKLIIRFIGNVDSNVVNLLHENNLSDKVEFFGYKPHSEISHYQKEAQVLLVLIPSESKEVLTGKIFEYLAAKRPILAVGPTGGDLDKLLGETGSGLLLPYNSELEIFEGLKWFWEGYKNNWDNFKPKNIEQFSRKELSRKMTELMNEVLSINE